MKKIIGIILFLSVLIPNISFGQVNQAQIDSIQKQIQFLLVQIQQLQTLLNNLQRSPDIETYTMPKEEVKKEEVKEIKIEKKKEDVKIVPKQRRNPSGVQA